MVYQNLIKELEVEGKSYKYYDLLGLNDPRYDDLPISIRYLLESAVRNCDDFTVTKKDVENILDWQKTQFEQTEIQFKPARVLLQDFTGVPCVVDLAAMRNSVQDLGSDPSKINPTCPVDLVIDHSVQVDHYGNAEALAKNEALEFERNHERFEFLKWGAQAFKNFKIVPPGSGIVHQINLEYLARVVFADEKNILYPDSVVGTDSHTGTTSAIATLSFGVGGIEAESVMLSQPISMVLPEVIGVKLTGSLNEGINGTDLVLRITQFLRKIGCVGKFVEFFGPGVASMSISDRASITNMSPEFGGIGFFSADDRTIQYLRSSGRDEHTINRIISYFKANKMFVDYTNDSYNPKFTTVVELDLTTIVLCVSGPKRPHDFVALSDIKKDCIDGLTAKVSFKGYGLSEENSTKKVTINVNDEEHVLSHMSCVLASITSCTNTSNPQVMLASGLVCKRANELGLKIAPYIKTSMSPGSKVVTKYLAASNLLPEMEKLGFHAISYGCSTCIGNSGDLHPAVMEAVEKNDLVVAGVLSGNRNFENRINPTLKASYLASPPLVIVFALAGRMDIDLATEPVGRGTDGRLVFFKDLWPTKKEIDEYEEKFVVPKLYKETYENIEKGGENWQKLASADTQLYPWDKDSTYIKKVPFFDGMKITPEDPKPIKDAYALLSMGDSITTDHISPAGGINSRSAAAKFLIEKGVEIRNFNTYGARRGNDEVMVRGTFANIRLINKLAPKVGPITTHIPSGEVLSVYDAAIKYKQEGNQVLILAGKEYGSGSSRDWAAKGPHLLNVKCVIAESYERIHRSNLIGMGLLVLQYKENQNAESLGLTGREQFSVDLPKNLKPGQDLTVKVGDGRTFEVLCRFDTLVEVEYFKNGGVLNYMVRKLIAA
uniref:Aconitate hydratase n=1 Tax=Rhabditophanes sp. KR3021 TaxID=114890 RepID=A0AC35U9D2_9BILA